MQTTASLGDSGLAAAPHLEAGSAIDLSGRREQVARRAYEISLSPDGGTPEANWLRAEQELCAQRAPYP